MGGQTHLERPAAKSSLRIKNVILLMFEWLNKKVLYGGVVTPPFPILANFCLAVAGTATFPTPFTPLDASCAI
jgi:hypothetical protein